MRRLVLRKRFRNMRFSVGAASLCGLLLAGCSTCDLVEAELRHQSNRVFELERQLESQNREIAALKHTLEETRSRAAPPDATGAAPAPSEIERLTLGAATGGRDRDRDGYDESLQVVLVPLDADGDARKVPGTARITVFDGSVTDAGEQLATFAIPPEQLRSAWRSSLFGQGYHLALPWQPAHDSIRVCAAFTTVEGAEFSAEKDCRIKSRDHQRIVPPRPNVSRSCTVNRIVDKSAEVASNPQSARSDGAEVIPPPPPLPPELVPPSSPAIDWIILPHPEDSINE